MRLNGILDKKKMEVRLVDGLILLQKMEEDIMEQEIKNMNEYNPRYTKRGALKWQKINNGKHPKKEYPLIAIEKIKLKPNKQYTFFEDTYNRAKEQYEATHEFIPVNLRAEDRRLRSGYEFYVLAKELGLKKIPYIEFRRATQKPKKR